MTRCDWIYGAWFISDPKGGDEGNGVDWLAQLYKADGQWVLQYRFRYYSPESKNPWDEKDRKSWYTAKSPGDTIVERDAMIHALGQLTPHIETQFHNKLEFVLLDCAQDDPKFFIELGSRPWAHVKQMPADWTPEIDAK